MGGYTISWARRPSFTDDGQRRRLAASLAEARMIMQMAFVAEPGFRPVAITDSTGRPYPFLLEDPLASEQDYLTHGLEHYDEWIAHPDASTPAPPVGADDD